MNFSKKLFAFIKISRPLNFLITFLVIVTACIICSEGVYPVIKILLAGLSGALTASAGNVINDYFDINIDRINRPDRILPSGELSLTEALGFYIALTAVASAISVFINIIAFSEVIFASALLFLYSKKLKRIPLLGNIIIAFLTGFAFIYGGLAVNNVKGAVIPAVFAFMVNLIREIIKDMEDTEGDKQQGVITLPSVYGFGKTKIIIVYLTIILMGLTFIPFITKLYEIEFLVVVMVFVNPLLIYILKSLYEDDSVNNLHRISNYLKLNMIFGLIAIFLGR